MKKYHVCVVCPNGCELYREDGKVRGALCKKGETWLRQEMTDPKRTIATSVGVDGGALPLVSVRTPDPISLDQIFPLMERLKALRLKAPVEIGTVILDEPRVITTKNIEKK